MHDLSSSTNPITRIWIADTDESHFNQLSEALVNAGFVVLGGCTAEPPDPADIRRIAAALIDDQFPRDELADSLSYLTRHAPHIRPLLMISNGRAEFTASDSGELDGIPKPVAPALLLPLIRQAIRSARDRRRTARLERRLHDVEAAKQAILESSLDCILATDDKGRITEANAATVLTFGYTRDELVGREMVAALFPDSQHERYRGAIEQFLKLGIEGSRMGRRLEVIAVRANGSEFPAELAFIPTRVGGRSIFTAYLRDISERKHAEEALRKNHERMKRDLEAASRIQMSLLPEALPRVREAALAWKYRPCDELAGDTLNVLRLDRDHLGIYVLDVSGHGVPAALHAVMLHRLLSPFPGQSMLLRERRGRIGGFEIVPPADVLDGLSGRFPMNDSPDHRYFTIHYGIIDLRTGRYCYAQGGHPGAIIVSPERAPRTLPGAGLPIGFDPSVRYEQYETVLSRGDRLILYSDGITEAANKDSEHFGTERLLHIVQETATLPIVDALEAILKRVTAWRGKRLPEDDISVLAVDWMTDLAPSAPTPRPE